ncbi:unnamed protein product [Lampetra planeri]
MTWNDLHGFALYCTLRGMQAKVAGTVWWSPSCNGTVALYVWPVINRAQAVIQHGRVRRQQQRGVAARGHVHVASSRHLRPDTEEWFSSSLDVRATGGHGDRSLRSPPRLWQCGGGGGITLAALLQPCSCRAARLRLPCCSRMLQAARLRLQAARLRLPCCSRMLQAARLRLQAARLRLPRCKAAAAALQGCSCRAARLRRLYRSGWSATRRFGTLPPPLLLYQ